MSLVIDLVLAGIVVFCGWRGFRTGIINGVCGILAVVIALYGANLLAVAFYTEFSDIVEPFALSVVEKAVGGGSPEENETEDGSESHTLTVEEREKLDVYTVSKEVMGRLGFSGGASEGIARDVASTHAKVNNAMEEELTAQVCARAAYVALFAIAFILIAIIFSVIGNIADLSFGIPGHENLNHVTGAALGVIRGLLIVLAIGCIGRYLGLLVPASVTDKTVLYQKLLETNKIAELLNI